ncbi:hypothetical protein HWQ46_02405 [Shewanella sp. D64]|uniref:hypothetical protein n=1 Tax=unclassified Shewanella TaxID=196818 RepID=UPI0022BA2D3D|nr:MULTISPECIES: hypothetical protein [unclassified Shewanella]MEC4724397.1 hypothetical protein [Shewanella sp. D64]MEC4736826.1 hypothetical protein [Shewanella sp. E94]WBJ94515.1 hypothetical protein HWQ47_22050 [Shewanella sp. MTB7]
MFKQTVQQLLTGAIICETAFDEEFQFLKLAAEFERVNDFLENIDRKLTYHESADAYYCTYIKVDSSNTAELMALFSEMRGTFRPLVEFLDLLLTASNADLPIHGKSVVNINELFEPFEQDQTLRDQLRRLTSIKPFKTNKEETREQLATLFTKLEEMHYFVRKNPGSSRYYATARFDIIYTLIEFLNDSERVELPNDPQVQQDELLF